jgi:hypothetical protein|tara:strand:+ start:4293 stop:5816 length:1524 start_codon:yes stop_codon:yes gene_type:complete
MAIKKYVATQDTTITNAFKANLSTRGSGSNMGASDVLEIFSIYAQASTSSIEKSRALVQFSTSDISTDRTAGTIPVSGSVRFFLRLYNAEHAFTLPRDFTLVAHAVSRSWSEGNGLDMEEYSDSGYANWVAAASSSGGETTWTTEGGDFHTGAYSAGTNLPFYSTTFSKGYEDLEVDVTALVEEWLAGDGTAGGARDNSGVGIYLTASQEDGSDTNSRYTKKFFARTSEFFYKRPLIEARWDSSEKDNAGNFYLSSSLASAADNLNTLYLYNYVRGQLKDIPSLATGGIIHLQVHSASSGTTALKLPIGGGVVADADLNVTGGAIKTGIYTASFAFNSSSITKFYPVWHSIVEGAGGTGTHLHTGSKITVNSFDSATSNYNPNPTYITNITNLRSEYRRHENTRFRLYTRQKDWNPTIYTKASADIDTDIVEDAYYRVIRVVDDFEIIPFGTGSSLPYTRMSYDLSGSYFSLDMGMLEAGYAYGIKLAYYINGAYHEQPEVFKFRVE